MSVALEEFLAGERTDDVAFFLSSSFVDEPGALADHGVLVEDGVVVVVDGEQGRSAFRSATGVDPMQFARRAMDPETRVDRDLTGGDCPAETSEGQSDESELSRNGSETAEDKPPWDEPNADTADNADGEHRPQFVFGFAEAENQEAGGIYAEGPVVHAYARCTCGASYSDRWVAGE